MPNDFISFVLNMVDGAQNRKITTKSDGTFTKQQIHDTEKMACVRIHIKRIMQTIELFQ